MTGSKRGVSLFLGILELDPVRARSAITSAWPTGGMMSKSTHDLQDGVPSAIATGLGGPDPAEVIRSFYRSFELRDLSRLGSLLAEDVGWFHGPGVVPSSLAVSPPDAPNRDAVVSFLAELVDRSGGTCRWRLRQLLRHGNGAIVAVQEVTAGGLSLDTGYLLFTVRADVIQQVVVLTAVPSDRLG